MATFVFRHELFERGRLVQLSEPQIFEQHLSPRTLAELWGYSEDTIRRWFEDVPGVLKCGVDGSRGKHRKMTIRIPRTVAERIYRERTK